GCRLAEQVDLACVELEAPAVRLDYQRSRLADAAGGSLAIAPADLLVPEGVALAPDGEDLAGGRLQALVEGVEERVEHLFAFGLLAARCRERGGDVAQLVGELVFARAHVQAYPHHRPALLRPA